MGQEQTHQQWKYGAVPLLRSEIMIKWSRWISCCPIGEGSGETKNEMASSFGLADPPVGKGRLRETKGGLSIG
jgi:hypothetical protein